MIFKTLIYSAMFFLGVDCATARNEFEVFRVVGYICSSGKNGVAVKTVENVLGQRYIYTVTYFQGRATLFVTSYTRNGLKPRAVKTIDIRTEREARDILAARSLELEIVDDDRRFCAGGHEQLQNRYELEANHQFNRSHGRYIGK